MFRELNAKHGNERLENLQDLREGKKKKRKKKRKGEIKLRYGIFIWIHDFCMDFGMLFVYKLLGYDCYGFP